MIDGRPAAVRAHDLRKAYGGIVAVDGVDFTVATAECFGFLGPNGAGKTTTMKMIYGLQRRVLATGPDALAVLGNAAWLLVVTVVLFFAVPARAMRRRLVA